MTRLSLPGNVRTLLRSNSNWWILQLPGKFILLFISLILLQILLVLLVAGDRVINYLHSVVYPNLQQQAVYLVGDLHRNIGDPKYLLDLSERLQIDFAIDHQGRRFVSNQGLMPLLEEDLDSIVKPRKRIVPHLPFQLRPPPPRHHRKDDHKDDSAHESPDDTHHHGGRHHRVFPQPNSRLRGVFTPIEWNKRAGLAYQEPRFKLVMLFNPRLVPFATTDLWLLAGGTILLLGLALLATRRILRPLHCLRQGIDNLDKGRFDQPIPVRSRDELGQLSTAFNQMSAHLNEQFCQREQLLLDISHELRSPLARMRMAVEMIKDQRAKTSLIKDIAQQEQLLSLLLDNARLGSITGNERLDFSRFSLHRLIQRVIASYDNPLVVAALPAEQLHLTTDRRLLVRVITNLIDNSLKYADNQPITVAVQQNDARVRLTISDSGKGIPLEQQQRVFAPFYRLDSSRTQAGQHTSFGLGLSLCKRIVEALGGNIDIDPDYRHGTRVRIDLPLEMQ